MSKTDWISAYSTNNQKRKFQAGGPMGPEAGGAPMQEAPQGGGAPDLEGMLAEYAQSRDPQLAVAICDSLIEMMAAQQGGAPQGGAPTGPPAAKRGMKTSYAPIF